MEDNDHLIIKTFGQTEISQYGMGYELFKAMDRNRDRIAQYMVHNETDQTFGELLEECIRVAINLKTDEFTDDEVLGISLGNHKETCVPFMAALFLGIKIITFDMSLSITDRVHFLKQVAPKVMFVEQTCLADVEESAQLAGIEIKLVIVGDDGDGNYLYSDYLQASDEDISNFEPIKLQSNKDTAVILFSSGTTGLPKGICLSHCGLLSQGLQLTLSGIYGNSPIPVALTFSHLSWVSSIVILISTCVSGISRVITKTYDVDELWTLIEKYKINFLFLSPFQSVELGRSSKPEGLNTSSLHTLLTGGGPISDKVIYSLRDILPGTFLVQVYGQTEICGVLTMFQIRKIDDQLLLHYRQKSVGRPVPGVWFKVVDTITEETLGPNEPGELRVKSDFVMNGYYRRDCSEAFDENGWLKTGDVVYYDEFQCFYVVERIKELLKFRSWHIPPTMLENILASHPAVQRAVVIGIPHEEDGDHPMGLVILNEGFEDTDPVELELYVENRVQDKQRLRGGVKIIDRIPTTNSGKIKRRTLRNMVLSNEL